jgi:hypothetical protein
MDRAGLALNLSDSALYIPAWRSLAIQTLHQQPGVLQAKDGSLQLAISDSITFPPKLHGIKVLGSPMETDDYCDQNTQTTFDKVQKEMDLLNNFLHLHQCI